MKCEDVSRDLIAYLDRRTNSADRAEIEHHLLICTDCRARATEFRAVWGVLDQMPAVEPSAAFDARVRARVAEEPRPGWVRWFVPQPRLAFSLALLLAASVWVVKVQPAPSNGVFASNAQSFEAIKDLSVLENYDVLTKVDALSELAPVSDHQAQPPTDDSGGS